MEKEIKKETKIEIKAEDIEKAKKAIAAKINQLNINDIILAAITPIAEKVIQVIDTVEIEGNRVRIKFK